jgi:hypothetical protein
VSAVEAASLRVPVDVTPLLDAVTDFVADELRAPMTTTATLAAAAPRSAASRTGANRRFTADLRSLRDQAILRPGAVRALTRCESAANDGGKG